MMQLSVTKFFDTEHLFWASIKWNIATILLGKISIPILKACIQKKNECEAVVVHTCNLSTVEAEAGGVLWIWDHPGLQSDFQDS